MAIDQRKRQKKLERRKAKQKAERRQLAQRQPSGLAAQFEQAAKAPVLHCCMMENIRTCGMGQVLLSRQLSNGQVAFASFLVDVYCLGVKDVIAEVASRSKYDVDFYGKLTQQSTLIRIKPECARKLVEGAVQFARDLGIDPHRDYRTAKLIFGDISADACTEEFKFGRNGKPVFIAGPHDSASRCEEIFRLIAKLEGPEGERLLIE
jgi:hypothetical protein